MPHPETAFRRQKAVLWEADGVDSYGQARVSEDGVEIWVRWNQRQREALDPNGNTITLDATVVVNRSIAIGSNMALGRLKNEWEDLGTANARDMELGDLHYVATYNETKDLKGRAIRRTVGLIRFRDTLPETT